MDDVFTTTRPKVLDRIPMVSNAQVAFGRRLGVDCSEKSVSVAWAMIEDVIQQDFWGAAELHVPTPKQIALAAKFGHDISNSSRRVGAAVIADLMHQLNLDAISEQGLSPGVMVVNKYDSFDRRLVISSIAEDGTVYFKGGNGNRAGHEISSELIKKTKHDCAFG